MKKLYLIIPLIVVALLTISTAATQEAVSELSFYFVALNDGGIDDEGVHHQLVMSGAGDFNQDEVVGSGSFIHFDNSSGDPAAGEPRTLLGTGTWEAESVVSWTMTDNPNNPYGEVVSGIVELEVRLFTEDGPEDGIPAILKVICNVPPAGIFTGEPEGYFLDTEDGLSFAPTSWPDTNFPVGLTLITRGRN